MISTGELKGAGIRKTIAVISVVAGVLWLCGMLVPLFRAIISENSGSSELLFVILFLPLMAIPAAIAIKHGVSLFRAMSISSLKWVIGVFCTFGALLIPARFSIFFPDSVSRHENGLFLLGVLVATPAYLLIMKKLLPLLGETPAKTSDLLGKGVLVLIAWLLWLEMFNIARECLPSDRGLLSGLFVLFVPMLAAYGVYRMAVALLLKPDS